MIADATIAQETSEEKIQELSTGNPKPIVVGFWRRFFADAVDLILLGSLGSAVSYPMRYTLSTMGLEAVCFGLIVSLLYYSLLHTSLGGGQTLGKRVLGIQVLKRNGEPLPFMPSLFRYLVIAFIFYNSLYFSLFSLLPTTAYIVISNVSGLLLVWVFLACFLLIPLHPLKRGLHDLVAGSIVVYKDSFDTEAVAKLENPEQKRRAMRMITLISILFVVIIAAASSSFYRSSGIDINQLITLQNTLNQTWNVKNINAQVVQNDIVLNFFVGLPLDTWENESERDTIRMKFLSDARRHVVSWPKLKGIRIFLVSGYNTGVSSMNFRETAKTLYPPQEIPESPEIPQP